MRKKLFLLPALLLNFWVSSMYAQSEQPNILFIAVDDFRSEIDPETKAFIQTPNLDRLAAQAYTFNHHYVQVPTCGASRFALLTGMRPSVSGHLSNSAIADNMIGKPEEERPESFVHHLRRNDYYTVGIGKMSHSADGYWYGYTEPVSEQREMPHSWNELLFDYGKWGTGWNAFFGYADGSNRQGMNRQVKPYEKGEVEDEGYPDGLTAGLAVDKIKELKDKDQPFFMGVGFFKPHLPFTAPQKYWDMYERDEIPLSPVSHIPEHVNLKSLHGSGEFNGYHLNDEEAGLDHAVSDEYARKLRHAYFASISYSDALIGKVLDELERLGLAENTIVVVWGDHGWHLGDQLVWGKHTLFEQALKSTLMIKVPGMEGNAAVNTVVETVDIYPTLMELSDIEPAYPTDGESLMPLLREPAQGSNELAYSYFRRGATVRNARYRLTKYFREEEPLIELFDHVNDPYESENIAESHPEIVEELMPLLQKEYNGFYQQ
ncbi:arylsulfatase A-like enzyme [Catalinimonas alkaloidigena]|uniref:sulfatase n=1 Tax=Catalinimonas alkaloidigena TaxID=1075417 RepID=UPI002404A62D|nr:sulfatase [Catalinimonas alkaloidigena]MDF9798530.1 arylsulfatase A-like enzyme [Catalinimonas alkaloidigena]